MKFVYEYRTSDNVSHRGVLDAATRDAAFAALKARGIRPSRVVEAAGFFNKLFGKGKRWIAIVVLAISLIGVVCYFLVRLRTSPFVESIDSGIRRQLIGDAGVIAKGIATGWSDVFADEADRYFASYAIPGVAPAQRTVAEDKLKAALAVCPAVRHQPPAANSLEARQIRALVEGMKRECRAYIADGTSLAAYHRALVRRQEQEIGYYQRAKAELDQAWGRLPHGAFLSLWEKRNAQLRKIGVRLVPWPEE